MKVGIVGLPNVGKSTVFNSLTRAGAEAQNYPFTTIDPNLGVANIPDERLDAVAGVIGSKRVVPATVEFVDIAGLVRGASAGEGLGNQFLGHIRECDAIAHVVRCFEDENVVHVHAGVDPRGDIEYGMGFDVERENDLQVISEGVTLLVSHHSKDLLSGTVLDYVEDACQGLLELVRKRATMYAAA